ncbi:radical SAM/SPASM domain-containing protein [Saccharicrinis aurantiacus]|uniref:radical SAM/SPASM domain-containing protein n=1 Tax=Saccharicrinis aurantiacus TaxID=1849719 RepID=UPI000837B9BE|nr:radical SAM protein [Saccharicrinis aurantiacus]
MSEYKATTAVWEITMACNMRCKHCGSSCENALKGELSTKEALSLCDEIAELGLQWITLSGGEPLTRKDWPLIAKTLRSNGVIPNIITNGWAITEDIVSKMVDSGIGTTAISIDGTEETHDYIRKKGSFNKSMHAFELLHKHNQYTGAITSISKTNINQLRDIKNILVDKGVKSWQLQICIPMGNMKTQKEQLIEPEDIPKILEFCLETARENKITVYPADCLGYYTEEEEEVRKISLGNSTDMPWSGCNAGIRGFGVLHNGDIIGCTSIRDREFIEGNIRERTLPEIWKDANSFAWSRNMKKADLKGTCNECKYGDVCLGGCPNTRLTTEGSIYAENKFCAYNVALSKLSASLLNYSESNLYKFSEDLALSGNYQESATILKHMLKNNPDDTKLNSLNGFVNFFLGNYNIARNSNEVILKNNATDWYALKGLGLCMHKMGESEAGITNIKKAIQYAPKNELDPLYDLAVVYKETGQNQKAAELIMNIQQL